MGKAKKAKPAEARKARAQLWVMGIAAVVVALVVQLVLTQSEQPAAPEEPPMQRPPTPKKARGVPSKKAAEPKKQSKCKDSDTSCASWAGGGECDANPGFMLSSCPLSCNACPEGDEDPACVRRNKTAAVQNGGISAIFERAEREYKQYNPKALSRDPWVMTFDNFLTEGEADAAARAPPASSEP